MSKKNSNRTKEDIQTALAAALVGALAGGAGVKAFSRFKKGKDSIELPDVLSLLQDIQAKVPVDDHERVMRESLDAFDEAVYVLGLRYRLAAFQLNKSPDQMEEEEGTPVGKSLEQSTLPLDFDNLVKTAKQFPPVNFTPLIDFVRSIRDSVGNFLRTTEEISASNQAQQLKRIVFIEDQTAQPNMNEIHRRIIDSLKETLSDHRFVTFLDNDELRSSLDVLISTMKNLISRLSTDNQDQITQAFSKSLTIDDIQTKLRELFQALHSGVTDASDHSTIDSAQNLLLQLQGKLTRTLLLPFIKYMLLLPPEFTINYTRQQSMRSPRRSKASRKSRKALSKPMLKSSRKTSKRSQKKPVKKASRKVSRKLKMSPARKLSKKVVRKVSHRASRRASRKSKGRR